jgi:hypothetical protein
MKIKNFIKSLYYSSNYYIKKSTTLYKKTDTLEKKYEQYIDRHYEILEDLKINRNLYSKAINCKDINNEYTNECIKLCYEDYKLAEHIINWQKELAVILNKKYVPINYGSNSILLKLLEKQEKYKEAIEMCDNYIKLGLTNDGTNGGIIKRKERLLKKCQLN